MWCPAFIGIGCVSAYLFRFLAKSHIGKMHTQNENSQPLPFLTIAAPYGFPGVRKGAHIRYIIDYIAIDTARHLKTSDDRYPCRYIAIYIMHAKDKHTYNIL